MRIAIFAGLGNQLFQYTFAHAVAVENGEKIEFALDDNPQEDRLFGLSAVLESCKHVGLVREMDIRELSGRSFKLKLVRKLKKIRLDFIRESLPIAYESSPYEYDLGQFQSGKLNVGYYQNWKYVSNYWDYISAEIYCALSKIKSSQIIIGDLNNIAVFHIRRGDLMSSMSDMGVLSYEYYLNAATKIRNLNSNVRIFCITDDIENSRSVTERLNAEGVFGPRQLGQWESLMLMSKAQYVVAANSTFSWWGAYLCAKVGGMVILPDPWFKNWTEEIGDAFIFPGVIKETSIFLESI